MKTRLAQVLVTFNLHNILPREVLLHEIPVLRVVHGENNIKFDKLLGEGEDVSPRAEFLRLKQQYAGRRDSENVNPVDTAYPDGSRDLEIVLRDGLEAFDRLTASATEEEELPEIFSDEEEDPAILVIEDEPVEDMDRAAVMARLTEKGIPFSVNTPTKHLIGLLHGAEAA